MFDWLQKLKKKIKIKIKKIRNVDHKIQRQTGQAWKGENIIQENAKTPDDEILHSWSK